MTKFHVMSNNELLVALRQGECTTVSKLINIFDRNVLHESTPVIIRFQNDKFAMLMPIEDINCRGEDIVLRVSSFQSMENMPIGPTEPNVTIGSLKYSINRFIRSDGKFPSGYIKVEKKDNLTGSVLPLCNTIVVTSTNLLKLEFWIESEIENDFQ